MFTIEQFDHLHSLWAGGAENMDEVCGKCLACCHVTDKILYPNEAEYLKVKSGQITANANSEGCFCKQSGTKLIFCKVYPMDIRVDLNGNWEFVGVDSGHMSHNCRNLTFKKDNFQEFYNYLFTDIHNILFHKIYVEFIPKLLDVQKTLEKQALIMDKDEMVGHELLLTLSKVLEIPFYDPYS